MDYFDSEIFNSIQSSLNTNAREVLKAPKVSEVSRLSKELCKQKQSRNKAFRNNSEKYLKSQERAWLKKQGKKHCIDLEDNTLRDLRNFYSTLSGTKDYSTTSEDIYKTLLALGLVQSRAEVQKLMDLVDSDKSGQISFDKFLSLLKVGECNCPSVYLKREVNRLKAVEDSSVLPFDIVVRTYLRRVLSDYYMSSDPSARVKGEQLNKAYIKVLGGGTKSKDRGRLRDYNSVF